MLFIKAKEEMTIARSMGGLNKEIADVVKLQCYVKMEDLEMKVEKQQK